MPSTPQPVSTNDLIRGAMAMRGKVQRDLAATLGVSQRQVSQRLSGAQDWRLAEIRKVADWLGIDVATLVSAAPDFTDVIPEPEPVAS